MSFQQSAYSCLLLQNPQKYSFHNLTIKIFAWIYLNLQNFGCWAFCWRFSFCKWFLHFDIFCWSFWDWALTLSAWINKRIGSEGKSAPFEVVPFTEEPFSHHWWTPHPPRIHRFIFNVPPIAQRNIFEQLPKRWDRAWYTCDVIWQDFNNIHNYLKYCG